MGVGGGHFKRGGITPLKKGRSRKAMSSNVRLLVKEGRPLKQAVAISYRVAGRSKKRRKVRKK